MTRRGLLGTLAVGLVAGFLRVFPRRLFEEEPEEVLVHELYLSPEMIQRAFDRIVAEGLPGPCRQWQSFPISDLIFSGCSSRLRTP